MLKLIERFFGNKQIGKKNNSNNLRKTVKGLPLFDHKKYGKTIIISKENSNGKWSLLGGGCNINELPINTLRRELKEEIGKTIKIVKNKNIGLVDTKKQRHRIIAVELLGNIEINKNEIETLGFYPLLEGYENERKALEKNMDYHAKLALRHFMEEHHPKKYNGSKLRIPTIIFENYKNEIKRILNS